MARGEEEGGGKGLFSLLNRLKKNYFLSLVFFFALLFASLIAAGFDTIEPVTSNPEIPPPVHRPNASTARLNRLVPPASTARLNRLVPPGSYRPPRTARLDRPSQSRGPTVRSGRRRRRSGHTGNLGFPLSLSFSLFLPSLHPSFSLSACKTNGGYK